VTATPTVEQLRDAALACGAAGLGVTTAAPFPEVRSEIERRSESGERGHLDFTYREPEVATDIRRSFPWARSLVVVAVPYLPSGGSPPPGAGTVRVARFATQDHYVAVRAVLADLEALLAAAGHRSVALTDDNRLVDRAAAVRAGVGWWGKSTLVLVPGAGPWVLLGTVVTDAPLEPSEPMVRTCGTCVSCIDACPTGAIVAPGVLDARLCIAHWAQVGGMVPEPMRRAMDDRLYGCDECLDSCPPGVRLLEISNEPKGRHDLVEVLGASDDDLLTRFAHLYIPKRRASHLRRNALIAAGNSRDPGLFDVVAGYTGHPEAVLRAHAVWALAEIDRPRADPILRFVHSREQHSDVLGELRELGVA
jgi:epoxyqueuosine reductase